ncbi:FAD-dependent oxidoreductase [Fulvitalea axinellae]|uniref:FAD-dependent oxidoreductase n=1 Tax=Fulvitalea axinellae TaxID=1182444 RepID=A0AAU9CJ96_9BACT|nr:FAD-dependent oxidoreductase [Fulvitalea axinellae]
MNHRQDIVSDVLVIGGGISGVLAAYWASKKAGTVTLLDAGQSVGGCVNSPSYNDFWFELGAHTCYNSYTHLLEAVRDANLEKMVMARGKASFKVLDQGKIVSIPSKLSFASLFANLPKLFFTKKDGKTVREFYSAITGKKNYDTLLTAMFNAVILQPADDFPADIFLKRRGSRDKSFPKSMSFKGGIQTLLKAFVDASGVSAHTGVKVVSVDFKDGVYEAKTEDDQVFHASKLVLATPPSITAGLVMDCFPDLAQSLSDIEEFSLKSFGFVVPKEALNWPELAGAVPLSGPYSSVVLRDVFPDEKYRSLTVHTKSASVQAEEAKAWLLKNTGLKESDLLFEIEKRHTVPSLKMGHTDRVNRIDSNLTDSLSVVGNYFYGLSLEDCAQRAKEEVLRLMKGL